MPPQPMQPPMSPAQVPPQGGQDPEAEAIKQLMEFLQQLDDRVTALEQGEKGEVKEKLEVEVD